MMRRVGERVRNLTSGAQIPWVRSSLLPQGFKFKPVPPSVHADSGTSSAKDDGSACGTQALDIQFWNAVHGSGNTQLLSRYLQLCPTGIFVDQAHRELNQLNGENENSQSVPPARAIRGWYVARYDNLDFWGGDLTEKGEISADADTCSRMCGANLECKMFSFNSANGRCFFKRQQDIPIVYHGAESGLFYFVRGNEQTAGAPPEIQARFRAYPDKTHWGVALPFNQPGARLSKINDCLRFCASSESCNYVTFDRSRRGTNSCLVYKYAKFGKLDKVGATAFEKADNMISPSRAPEYLPELSVNRGQN